jgi:hypothetical protein
MAKRPSQVPARRTLSALDAHSGDCELPREVLACLGLEISESQDAVCGSSGRPLPLDQFESDGDRGVFPKREISFLPCLQSICLRRYTREDEAKVAGNRESGAL